MITPDFSIYDLVQNMRTQRPSLVQTKVGSCQVLPSVKDLLVICASCIVQLTERVLLLSSLQEQYELVYRTIKVLFERYLQSADAQTCRNEVSDQEWDQSTNKQRKCVKTLWTNATSRTETTAVARLSCGFSNTDVECSHTIWVENNQIAGRVVQMWTLMAVTGRLRY